jgi:hypothetical protein
VCGTRATAMPASNNPAPRSSNPVKNAGPEPIPTAARNRCSPSTSNTHIAGTGKRPNVGERARNQPKISPARRIPPAAPRPTKPRRPSKSAASVCRGSRRPGRTLAVHEEGVGVRCFLS